jgi:hypothetical protein
LEPAVDASDSCQIDGSEPVEAPQVVHHAVTMLNGSTSVAAMNQNPTESCRQGLGFARTGHYGLSQATA